MYKPCVTRFELGLVQARVSALPFSGLSGRQQCPAYKLQGTRLFPNGSYTCQRRGGCSCAGSAGYGEGTGRRQGATLHGKARKAKHCKRCAPSHDVRKARCILVVAAR